VQVEYRSGLRVGMAAARFSIMRRRTRGTDAAAAEDARAAREELILSEGVGEVLAERLAECDTRSRTRWGFGECLDHWFSPRAARRVSDYAPRRSGHSTVAIPAGKPSADLLMIHLLFEMGPSSGGLRGGGVGAVVWGGWEDDPAYPNNIGVRPGSPY